MDSAQRPCVYGMRMIHMSCVIRCYLVVRGCVSAIFHRRWLGLHRLVQQGLLAGSASANLCFFKLVEMRNDEGLCLVSLLHLCLAKCLGNSMGKGYGLLPRELARGFRRDTRGTLGPKHLVEFVEHLHTWWPLRKYATMLHGAAVDNATMNQTYSNVKKDPRFAHVDVANGYACLREPANTNVSASVGSI